MVGRSLVLLLVLGAGTAEGAQVKVSVSRDEIQLGEELIVEVAVINAQEHEPPHWPAELKDFQMTGKGGPSINTTVNGMVVTKRYLYQYQLTAKREGRLTIPSITVSADGEDLQTEPMTILVTKSQTGELFLAELSTEKTDVYVQEPVALTLRLWIYPFRRGRIELKPTDMFQMIRNNSQWGIFKAILNQGKVSRRKRDDGQGVQREYYVYEWTQRVWPERAGPLELEPITIQMEYPLELERNFIRGLVVSRSRPFIRTPAVPEITVKPIPEAGRPKIYPKGGAVGRFAMAVTAKPTEVRVGDPITLRIAISGSGRLEYVSAPPLDEVPELIEHFKVHEESLPGQIEDGAKVFTQSIRAKDAAATEIPPIPFAFFDPRTEAFRTIYSDPISLKVEAASEVDAEDVVAAATDAKTRLLTEAGGGLLANYSNASELLATQATETSWVWAVLAGICPIAYGVTFVTTRRRRRLREDVGLARRRSARRRARERLSEVRQVSEVGQQASVAATAVMTYIADRLNLPSGGMTRPDALDHLRRQGVDREVIDRTDSFLAACEAARFAGRRGSSVDALLGPAHECIKELEKARLGSS